MNCICGVAQNLYCISGNKKTLENLAFPRVLWRRRWDSNPRYLAVHLISSQARYDHFDTPPCNNYSIFKVYDHRIAHHFECCTFDHSDNSPYISSVILAPEECKKNTQERYEIVKSEPVQSPVRWTFSAGETAGTSKKISSQPHYDHFDTAAYHGMIP